MNVGFYKLYKCSNVVCPGCLPPRVSPNRAAACGGKHRKMRASAGRRLRPARLKEPEFIYINAPTYYTLHFRPPALSCRSVGAQPAEEASQDAGLRGAEAAARPAQRAGVCRESSSSAAGGGHAAGVSRRRGQGESLAAGCAISFHNCCVFGPQPAEKASQDAGLRGAKAAARGLQGAHPVARAKITISAHCSSSAEPPVCTRRRPLHSNTVPPAP